MRRERVVFFMFCLAVAILVAGVMVLFATAPA